MRETSFKFCTTVLKKIVTFCLSKTFNLNIGNFFKSFYRYAQLHNATMKIRTIELSNCFRGLFLAEKLTNIHLNLNRNERFAQ